MATDEIKTSRPAGSDPDVSEHYHEMWKWDEVKWASHCIDCYPGNCPLRVYMKDGKIIREEQAAVFSTVQEGVPDLNPMGCQKGAGWNRLLTADERVIYPMRRVGERGDGRWEQITWDEACTEIADSILDALEEVGPESIIAPSGCNIGTLAIIGRGKFLGLLGGLTLDLNAEMNDFSPGTYMTWGTFDPVSSIDDWFHSEVFLIWFGNPVYTRIPHYHFIAEARYRGCEVVNIAPDVGPSATHVDHHIPVRPGTDAAFALAMCNVVVEEGLVNEKFLVEQTDMALLVNPETKCYLRESEVVEGGSKSQFFAWDSKTGAMVEAPRGTLFWGEVEPALEGTFTVETLEGPVEVTTVYALMKERLAEYTPERAAEICDIDAEMITALARKIATKRTNILGSLNNASKHYHGDLIERAQCLLLALTGNWGKHGTGMRAWTTGFFDGMLSFFLKPKRGPEPTSNLLDMADAMLNAALTADPTLTRKIIAVENSRNSDAMGFVPPVFFWYHHAGYAESWRNADWHDPSMPRPFDEYFNEAVEKGWWAPHDKPDKDHPPRILIECGGNVLRRTRGGSKRLLEHLWPQVKKVVTMDVRMSATALHSDIVLPIAQQYEKLGFGIPSCHTMNLTFCDRAVEPAGEAVQEWEAFRRIAEKIQERAKARGIDEVKNSRGQKFNPSNMHDVFTANGDFVDEDTIVDDMIRDTALFGTIPESASLQDIREKGYYRWQDLGMSARAVAQATDPEPDKTFVPFRKHVEDGEPYPTLTRRSQFLIDHPWFIEADEHLPTHKEAPKSGGDYPFQVSSGHNRWSIHSLNTANPLMLETHRGEPHIVISDVDAAELGIADHDKVRVFNDVGEFEVAAKISSGARPGQVVMYNGFDNYQFPNWAGPNDAEPGMFKWLHLAGGYGHLKYWGTEWQPCPVMRNTRVGIEKL